MTTKQLVSASYRLWQSAVNLDLPKAILRSKESDGEQFAPAAEAGDGGGGRVKGLH